MADSFKDSNPVLSSVLHTIASGGNGAGGGLASSGGGKSGGVKSSVSRPDSGNGNGNGNGGGLGLGNVLLGSGDSPLMDAVVLGVTTAVRSEATKSMEQVMGGRGPVASFIKSTATTGSVDQVRAPSGTEAIGEVDRPGLQLGRLLVTHQCLE